MLGDGLACYDLDYCIDDHGRLSDQARAVLANESPIWVERSVSGTGLHVFVPALGRASFKQPGVEFYSRGRFVRVTGDRFVTDHL